MIGISSSISSFSGSGVRVPIVETTCVKGIGACRICPAPRSAVEGQLLDAGVELVLVDMRGPLIEDAENSEAEGPVDKPSTTCVGDRERRASDSMRGWRQE